MRYCRNCSVDVRGDRDTCPLCHNSIQVTGVDSSPTPYPNIPLQLKRHLAIRILIFLSIITIALSFFIYWIWPSAVNWPLLVLFGIGSTWLIVGAIIRKRHNIAKTIVYQIAILSLISVFWDYRIGWSGWSVTYAIPMICISALLSMFIAVRVMALNLLDYILYLMVASLLGLVPLVFLLMKWVDRPIPSVVSISLSFVMLVAVIVFRGNAIVAELKKKFTV